MKKTMKTAAALLSAVTMLGTCAVPAFAGELTREELIRKYAPDGAYSYDDIYVCACSSTFPTVMADGSAELEHNYVQKLEESGLSVDEQIEALRNRFYDFPDGKIYAYNDYRRCIEEKSVQWFVNAEYENGFWYVIQADGTASIVGADQDWVNENSPSALHIPAEIGGAKVTKIEDNAFAFAVWYNHDLMEITVPDTVEIIGDGAFHSALIGQDCKLNLPQNVKYIGRMAYYGTMHLLMDEFEVIHLPESVEFIGKWAFEIHSDVHRRNPFGDIEEEYEKETSYKGHLAFFDIERGAKSSSGVDYILDMPDSPVYCEESCSIENLLGIRDFTTYPYTAYPYRYSPAKTYYERVYNDNEPIYYITYINDNGKTNNSMDPDDPDARYLTLKDFLENPEMAHEAILSQNQLYAVGDHTEILEKQYQRSLKQAQKVKAFTDAYDTTRISLYDTQVIAGGVVLYNECDAVTLDDVADFYAKREAKPAPAANLAGDVNCSGAVDISDAVLLARFLNEDAGAIITDAGIVNADTDASGAVDAEDVIAIQRIIAKII